jgi:ParB-like chromosome segregation protein Spo0J
MILNGHHRWGGAIQADMKTLPVRIVDLTQKKDIQEMLRNAGSNRRVTLDLDETVFLPAGDPSP